MVFLLLFFGTMLHSPSRLFVLSKIFCGLISRCATFLRCKYSSAFSTSRTQMRTFGSGSDSFSSKIACNSPPAALEVHWVRTKRERDEIYELTFNAHTKNICVCVIVIFAHKIPRSIAHYSFISSRFDIYAAYLEVKTIYWNFFNRWTFYRIIKIIF